MFHNQTRRILHALTSTLALSELGSMVGHFSSNKRLLSTLAGASIAAVVAVMLSTSSSTTLAATPTVVNDRPLSETTPILKIKDVALLKSASSDSNIELQVVPHGLSVAFMAKNKGQNAAPINVDRWEATITGESWSSSEPVQISSKASIPATSASNIAEIDLSNHSDVFELYPGTYTIDVIGWRWYEKDFGNFTKAGNWQDYEITANVTVDYDVDKIKASQSKILDSSGMQIGIEGEGNLYQVNQNSSKKVTFYIVNDGKADVSGVVVGSEFNMWNSGSRFPGVGTTTTIDPDPNSCEVLKPGEKKAVDAYELSDSSSPLAGPNGLSKQLGSESAIPGMYIAHMQVGTVGCATPDGQQIPGGLHTEIVTFEVGP
jgi:hypothetical protein